MPSFKSLLMTATLASLSAAHVVLENPKPYKFVADGPTNPISSTGSDFPCKIPPGQSYIIDGEPTPMTIGEDQTLSFQGHAVHGGGSCQLALSRGFPTKDSPWMVIHSIEGGCPARGQKGNLEGPNKDKYTFKIPEGIEPGTNWTLAWTWQSRIGGGPEFYMNCAPITILPSTKKRTDHPAGRRYAVSKRNTDFPELFMANMGEFAGGCTTSDAQRVQIPIAYPNPGASVDRPEGDNLFKQMCDGNPRAKKGTPAAGNGDGNGGASGALPTEPSSTSSSASPSSSSSASSSPAASSSSAPTSSAASETTFIVTSSSAPSSSAPTTPSSASASASTSTSAQIPSSSAAPPTCGGQCTEGHLTCLEDGTHFATCTGGQLTAHQPTPPGYKCKPGSGLGLEISPM
ncbi:hypothetical protein F5Y01DRAFT_329912 [Xylaria sp. FL0043]|nr:hypothetical protein F5Y01DRAFT_329912 [Xylaria sp. FL0043]